MTNEFTVGSQWETREGGRCIVLRLNKDGTLLVWQDSDPYTHELQPDGSYMVMDDMHPFDLIRPWKEPEAGKCYLYIGKAPDGTIVSAQLNENIDYKFPIGYKSLARIAVNWKRGQFDD